MNIDAHLHYGSLTCSQVGPAKFEMSQQKLTHLFDGFAKVSAVHFHNNTAHFSAKFIRTKFFNDSTNCECIAPGVLVRIPLSVSGQACKLRPVSEYRRGAGAGNGSTAKRTTPPEHPKWQRERAPFIVAFPLPELCRLKPTLRELCRLKPRFRKPPSRIITT